MVRRTYLETYQTVFGVPPADALGKAGRIMERANELGIPVRLFCLVYMTFWADMHPMRRFFSRYVIGDSALKVVRHIVESSRAEYATVTEDRLAMLLMRDFQDDKPVWRHKPTPTEKLIDRWLAVFREVHGTEYVLQKRDIPDLLMYTSERTPKEVEDDVNFFIRWLRNPERPALLGSVARCLWWC